VALTLLLVGAHGCYGSEHGALTRASNAWRVGDRDTALHEARAMYDRFAGDNPEATARAAELLPELRRILAEREPTRQLDPDADLRARLLSVDAAATLPAIASVEGLGLRRHGQALLAIISRRDAWQDSSDLTADLDVGTRSMLVKTMALEAMTSLARGDAARDRPMP
jgi:hypothetical protein